MQDYTKIYYLKRFISDHNNDDADDELRNVNSQLLKS